MQRRFSPILLTALLVCGGLPIASSRQEPEPEPKQPDPKQPESPGVWRPRIETYSRRYFERELLITSDDKDLAPAPSCAALDVPYATIVAPEHLYQPCKRPVKRPHAPRDRAAQRAAKKIKSAAKKRKGR